MRVYLYGERGRLGNFKITTAEVHSSLDSFIEEVLTALINREIDGGYNSTSLTECWGYSSIRAAAYWVDVDSGKSAKRVTKKMWEEAVKEYSDKNIDKVAKYELLRKSGK